MPHEIRIPRLGWSMEEGAFVGWLKQPGEMVSVGEPLFELEGEKALQEIESVDAGILYVPPDAPQAGSVVAVGALLGYLLAPGEAIPEAGPPQAPVPMTVASDAGREVEVESAAHDLSTTAASPQSKLIATPRAKRIAGELGVDWTSLHGTGRNGRVREADVRAVSKELPAPAKLASNRRKAIAERLRLSRDRTIPVTLTTSADATNLAALREQFKSHPAGIVPAYTDIVSCLVARVYKRHPKLAIRWDFDGQSLLAIPEDEIHIGIAVEAIDNLLVPVLQNVARKPLLAIAQESKALIERARSGRLAAAEMQGGAITITNLGAYGVDAFTPIINYPEIMILGLGVIRDEAAHSDSRFLPRRRITLSLTFDHAAVDGASAAAFLQDVASAIENSASHLLCG